MRIQFLYTFSLLLLSASIFGGCKNSGSTDSGDNSHPITGEVTPGILSSYSFTKWQTNNSGEIIIGTQFPALGAVLWFGKDTLGRSKVFTILDDGDTTHFVYESNTDVSMYIQNPHLKETETSETIGDLALHRWVTLPIATQKQGLVSWDTTTHILISGDATKSRVTVSADYIGEENFALGGGEIIASKHCKLNVRVIAYLVQETDSMFYSRDLWFVPKIGYFAKYSAHVNIPAIPVLTVARDTSASLKILSSYVIK